MVLECPKKIEKHRPTKNGEKLQNRVSIFLGVTIDLAYRSPSGCGLIKWYWFEINFSAVFKVQSETKATGWLGALVRVTNLKFWFLRVRKNAGICRSRQKMFATWTFISIGRRVTQEWKFAFRLRGDSILPFKGQIKNIRNLWVSTIRIISGRHSLFQFFPLLDASGARALVATQVPQSATRQRCDAMSSCRPKCTFFVHLRPFGFFCGASTEVAIFSSVSMFHPFVEYQPQWFYRILLNIQKKQILYPHLRKPHFWNLQPFLGIVNGTSQNWQPPSKGAVSAACQRVPWHVWSNNPVGHIF